jgi:hypothetical protein
MVRGPRCCFGVRQAPEGMNVDQYIRWGLEEKWNLMRIQPQGDIFESRLALRQQIPFRVETCTTCPMLCCGQCGKPCPHRCVQYMLHRTWSICSGVNENSPKDLQEFKKMAYLPGMTFHHLSELFSQFLTTDHNRRLKEYPEHPYTQDYAPAFKYTDLVVAGRLKRAVDPETGVVEIYEWPESGLCPYCLPYVSATLSMAQRYESRTRPHKR